MFKWEARKAPELLLSAYLSEFTSDDDVALYVRCSKYHDDGDVRARIRALANEAGVKDLARAARVLLVNEVRDTDMPALYKSASALVLPSRGEGWGRPHVVGLRNRLRYIGPDTV